MSDETTTITGERFGDLDPEDVYDVGDPVPDRVAVLRRVVAELTGTPDDGRHERRRIDALRVLTELERFVGVRLKELVEIREALERL